MIDNFPSSTTCIETSGTLKTSQNGGDVHVGSSFISAWLGINVVSSATATGSYHPFLNDTPEKGPPL